MLSSTLIQAGDEEQISWTLFKEPFAAAKCNGVLPSVSLLRAENRHVNYTRMGITDSNTMILRGRALLTTLRPGQHETDPHPERRRISKPPYSRRVLPSPLTKILRLQLCSLKVTRSRNFPSMNFPQIWYEDSFRVSDVNFNKKRGGHRVRLVTMVTRIS